MKRQYVVMINIFILGGVALVLFAQHYRPADVPTVPEETTGSSIVTEAPTETTTAGFMLYDVPLDAELQDYINYKCEARGIPPSLVYTIINRESKFDADAVGAEGEIGLMQVHPCNKEALAKIGIDNLFCPYQNVRAGIGILAAKIEATDNYHMALMAYNLGEGGAAAQWRQGIYETEYSREVLAEMKELEAGRP